MRPILWKTTATADLARIVTYLAERSPRSAREIRQRIKNAVLTLARHPHLYRPGRVRGTREIVVHPNYVIVYRDSRLRIEILNVLHARQRFP